MSVLSLQPDATAGLDTQMDSANANTNYGTRTGFITGWITTGTHKYRSLIQFDLSSLPSDAVVSAATLTLTKANASIGVSGLTITCYPVLLGWTESGATWNKYDGASNWNTAGCGGAGTDHDTSIGSTSGIATGSTTVAISLSTSWFESVAQGATTNRGFMLQGSVESGLIDYYWEAHSSDAAVSGNRPLLEVTYTQPINLTPSVLTVSATTVAPSTSLGTVSLSVAAITLAPAEPTPSLTLGAVSLSPAAISVSPVGPDPGTSLGAVSLSPAVVDVPVAIPAHVMGMAIYPDVVAVAVALPGTTMTLGDAALAPAALAVSPAVVSPSISAALSLAVSAIAATPSPQAPTITVGGVSLSPAVVGVPYEVWRVALDMAYHRADVTLSVSTDVAIALADHVTNGLVVLIVPTADLVESVVAPGVDGSCTPVSTINLDATKFTVVRPSDAPANETGEAVTPIAEVAAGHATDVSIQALHEPLAPHSEHEAATDVQTLEE